MDEHRKKINLAFFKRGNEALNDAKSGLKSLNVGEKGHRYGCMLFVLALISIVTGAILAEIIMPILIGSSKEMTVPDITGMTIKNARTELEVRGLDMRISSEEYCENIEPGFVISQTPLPNANIKFNKVVEIVVSKGSEKVQIPSIKGLHISNAIDALSRAGFVVNDTSYDFSADFDENIATGSEPPYNSIISKGSTITVYVSKGKKENYVLIPSFVNNSLDSVMNLARMMKIVPKVIDTIKADVGRVIVSSQIPDSGAFLKKGDTIRFIVKVPEI